MTEISKAEEEIKDLRDMVRQIKINKIAIETSSELLVQKLIGAEVTIAVYLQLLMILSKRNGDKYYGN